jgi:hypothetical protein
MKNKDGIKKNKATLRYLKIAPKLGTINPAKRR